MNDAFMRELDNDLADGFLTQQDYDRFKAAMADYDGQLHALQDKLGNGQINRDEYVEEYGKLSTKIRALSEEKRFLVDTNMKKRQKRSENRFKLPIIVGIVAIVAIVVGYKVINGIYAKRSISGIPEPVQIDLEGRERAEGHIVHGADVGRPGYEMKMNYLAKYDIKGLVIDTYHFKDETAYDKSFPVDVGLGWGDFAANRDIFDCNNGPRKLGCSASGENMKKIGANMTVFDMMSNNHLSPSSREIYDKMMKIQAGDYVEIEGYLVRVEVVDDQGDSFEATSSLSRTDHMDGAFDRTNTGCELIYVTSIEWLD